MRNKEDEILNKQVEEAEESVKEVSAAEVPLVGADGANEDLPVAEATTAMIELELLGQTAHAVVGGCKTKDPDKAACEKAGNDQITAAAAMEETKKALLQRRRDVKAMDQLDKLRDSLD